MGSVNTKTQPEVSASQNLSPEVGGTPEIHGTQPAHEAPSDASHMTTQVHCVEDRTQQPTQVYCFEDRIQQPTQVYCVEDRIQEPAQEGNEGYTLVSKGMEEGQEPQKTSGRDSETPSLARTPGSLEVVCEASKEGEIAPELIELIEKYMAESDASSTRTDILCQSCLSGEGSGDTSTALEYNLCSPLTSESEPRVSKELPGTLLPPPPVETLESGDMTEEAEARKEFKETRPDVPVAKALGEEVAGLDTQHESPEAVRVSDAASQTVPVGQGAEVEIGMNEGEEAEEIWVCSRTLKTEEKGANGTVDGQK